MSAMRRFACACALLSLGATGIWLGAPGPSPRPFAPLPSPPMSPAPFASSVAPPTSPESMPASLIQRATGSAPQLPTDQIPGTFRCPANPIMAPAAESRHSFYFTRGAYSSDPFSWRGSAWATDFEKADRQLLMVLERVLPIDAFSCENPIRLDDPALRRFPFLYMVEVGYMRMTPPEVAGLRDYLLRGGFLLVDDFWGSREWANFESEMRKALPEYPIVDIPMDHLIFRTVYPVREVLQVPSIGNARRGVYHEQDGFVPHMRGIFDEDGRLMVAAAWNSDLGDAWEWAEQPDYPWDRSNYALQMAINFILYAMTH